MRQRVLLTALLTATGVTHAAAAPWWEDAVVYEVFVRSFHDSDGDGIGDFMGLEQKLDYIEELGATALWLMPSFATTTYHGYDIVDYYAVNEEYGSMEDFESLLRAARARGMRVIVDLVLNHSSSENEWFKRSVARDPEYDDWYIWRDEPQPGKWIVYGTDDLVEGGGWRYSEERGQYYYAYFVPRMPDLNILNPAVREELKKVARFWIEKGVSGFRLDAAQNIVEYGPGPDLQKDSPGTVAWWVEFNAAVKAADPEAMLVGEVWTDRERIGRYHVRGKGLDRCFDFPFAQAVRDALSSGDPAPFVEAAMTRHGHPAPPPFYAPFLANHDQPRILTSLGGDLDKARRAAVLLLTAPGTPFLYYGEEIGMQQGRSDGEHPSARTPMQWDDSSTGGYTAAAEPWSPVAENADPYNVAHQSGKDGSLLELYRTLIHLRKERPEFRHGDYAFFDVGDGVLAFRRSHEGDSMLVLMNLSESPQAVDGRHVSGRYTDLLSEEDVAVADRFVLQTGSLSLLAPVEE